jgi:DNA invertase Pin-like site-specific DNA recombinase
MAKTSKTQPTSCVVYERVSTEAQSSSGLGLKSQRDMCKGYARSNNLRIRKYYTDAGISGTKGVDQRPALSQMLSELKPGTVVLVAKRDRISRDTFLSLWVEKECKKVHAVIESASGEGNGDSPADEMMRRIVDAFSEYERNLISQRTKNALAKSKKRLGRVPYGFKKDSSGRVIKDAETYGNYERIISMRERDGMGWSAICQELNADGIKTQRGKQWSPTVVMRICHRVEHKRIAAAMTKERKEEESREI